MHNMRRRISVFFSTSLCTCAFLCVYVCVAQTDAWLPIDVIIFHLQALTAWVQIYIFIILSVLFCVCLCMHMHTCCVWMCVVEGGREEGVFLCACVCFTKFVSPKKFQTLSGAFWLAKNAEKSHFLLKFLQQRSYSASSVTASRESVQVTGTNTIFHLVQEQAFELTLYVGWLSIRLAGTGLMFSKMGMGFTLRGKRWHDQLHQQKSLQKVLLWVLHLDKGSQASQCCCQRHRPKCLISTMDSTLFTAPWFQAWSLWFI